MVELNVNERIWQIDINGCSVLNLFDAQGSETFDPTQAVEVLADSGPGGIGLQCIKENDVFTFTLIADGP